MTTPCQDSDYASYPARGTATITGQAFGRTKGGDVKIAAGARVTLDPVAPCSTEAINKIVVQGSKLEEGAHLDPVMLRHRRSVVADAQGRFTFDRVPAGRYYAVCLIQWTYSGGEARGYGYELVQVTDGDRREIVLTPRKYE
jgi:hypothetical protein